MCGIVGICGRAVSGGSRASEFVQRASSTLVHRGPDGSGTLVSDTLPIALGHRRLSVLDLSDAASQPMRLDSGHSLVFNGEIYNYRLLRERLAAEGESFASSGDTEVLLRACRAWGVERTLERIRGMFAFGFLDESTDTLWLARDRFGEKPLYYGCWDGTLAFASELRALRAFPGFPTSIDLLAVEALMRHSCIGGERSIYRAVRKVRPGTAIAVSVSDDIRWEGLRHITYWDPITEARAAAGDPFRGDLDDAADELDELLGASVVGCTVSDVPVGAFLSGGVDSASVVSQLRRRSTGTVNTFTIGFGHGYRNEADSARAMARHLGSHHTELTITSQDALDLVPSLPTVYDEPFADSSQIPTFLVAQLASQSVTVALSGDGGDELFAGYPRYRLSESMWRWTSRTPRPVRAVAAAVVGQVPDATWRRLGDRMAQTRLRSGSGGLDERVAKLSATLAAERPDDVYRLLVTSFWERSIVMGGDSLGVETLPSGSDLLHRMTLRDTCTYLPDDILTKVDRAAMAVSLETRVPMLTPELFGLAHRLPEELLVSRDGSKLVLRHLLARHVPRDLWDGPKRGFSIPLGAWLRGPLGEWGSDLVAPSALKEGPLDVDKVTRLWDEHQCGRRDWGSRLWNVVMFQAWCAEHHPSGISFEMT